MTNPEAAPQGPLPDQPSPIPIGEGTVVGSPGAGEQVYDAEIIDRPTSVPRTETEHATGGDGTAEADPSATNQQQLIDSLRGQIADLHETISRGEQRAAEQAATEGAESAQRHQEAMGAQGAVVAGLNRLIEAVTPPRPPEPAWPQLEGRPLDGESTDRERAEAELLRQVTEFIFANNRTINLGALTRPTADQVPATPHALHGTAPAGKGRFGLSVGHANEVLKELARIGVLANPEITLPDGRTLRVSELPPGASIGDRYLAVPTSIPPLGLRSADQSRYEALLRQIASTTPSDEYHYHDGPEMRPRTAAQEARFAEEEQARRDRELLEPRDGHGLLLPDSQFGRLADYVTVVVDHIGDTAQRRPTLFVARRSERVMRQIEARMEEADEELGLQLDDEQTAALDRELARIQAGDPRRIDHNRALLIYANRLLEPNDRAAYRGHQPRQEHLNTANRTHALALVIDRLLNTAHRRTAEEHRRAATTP
jgi:hypothetical protein